MHKLNLLINCDVGEGLHNEVKLFPYLSSCNVACGGHTGDQQSMRKIVQLAKKHHIAIGAHPSYPDTENFGRKTIEISYEKLQSAIVKQIQDLLKITTQEDSKITHIKPHGALYNDAAKDENIAVTIINVINKVIPTADLYAPYNSIIAQKAIEKGINVIYEGFADRNYNDDLSLVSRQHSKAVITDPKDVYKHLKQILTYKEVITITGKKIPFKADTYCIHGDNPNALIILKELSKHFSIQINE